MAFLTKEMRQIVREQRLGSIATVTPQGLPSIAPNGSLALLEDETVVLADVSSPRTVANIASNPCVEVLVVDPFKRKGVRMAGTATVVPKNANYWKMLEMYRAEGSDISRIKTVVAIVIHRAEIIKSPVYSTGITEEELTRLWQEYFTKAKLRTVHDLIPPRNF
ncbi:MAG: pyridoxamine 5'-phosphate oxidase family protein [Thermoplasmata archaeon]